MFGVFADDPKVLALGEVMREKGSLVSSLAILLSLCACEGVKSYAPPVTKEHDKNLTCAQLEMEINEVETHRRAAMENQSFNLANLMSPFSYPSTAMNADAAINATEQRSLYLKQIYGIRRCGSPETTLQEARLMQPPYVQPQPTIHHSHGVGRSMHYAPSPYGQPVYRSAPSATFNGQPGYATAMPSAAPANWPAPPPPIGAYPPAGVPLQPEASPAMAAQPYVQPQAQPQQQLALPEPTVSGNEVAGEAGQGESPVQLNNQAAPVLTPPAPMPDMQPVGEVSARRLPGYIEF